MAWSLLRSWLKGHEGQKTGRGRWKTATSRRPRFLPYLEVLERREVLSTLLVTNTASQGPGSLDAAIRQADADGGGDQIFFNIASGVQTIAQDHPLTRITAPVTIDGYGQGPAITPNNLATPNTLGPGQGTNANLSVQLTAVAGGPGFGLRVASSGVVIRGLSIFGFTGAGIVLDFGCTGAQIAGDFLGVDALGQSPPSKNAKGIWVDSGANGNTVGGLANADRNLISANADAGIFLQGDSNTVVNNLVGTDLSGEKALGNGVGVSVEGNRNTIGGTTAAARNVISGNAGDGVDVFGPNDLQGFDNQVLGNYIGLDASGQSADGNQQAGVVVNNASGTTVSRNVIGGNNAAKNNQYAGISIGIPAAGGNSDATLVTGNLIGLAADGLTAVGNGWAGILVQNSTSATIGGTTVGAGNIIAGNAGDGIALLAPSSGTLVQDNYIGLGNDGVIAQGNTANGIRVTGASATVGGTATGARNIISGNQGAGILVNGMGTALIQNNYIGLGADGATQVGNNQQGIFLDQDKGSTVGGTTAGAGNAISGNKAQAVDILHGNSNDVVQGNRIGTNAAGNAAVGNGGVGVLVNGSFNVTVGGTAAGAGNLISGNTGGGVDVSGSSNTMVAGNLIGTDVTGQLALGNVNYGVQVENGASGTTIGGTTASARNVISGNVGNVRGSGVFITQTAGSTVVQGNFIGTNLDGTEALGNSVFGVLVWANQVTIGGTASGAGNVISGNGGSDVTEAFGIVVSDVKAGVTIQGNFIGTNAAGTATLGKQRIGVFLVASNGVTVGGTAAGAGNVISGNASEGVNVRTGSNNLVAGNLIGTDVSGNSAVANGTAGDVGHSAGVEELLSSNLRVFANTISGNNGDGILLRAGSNIAIQSNTIGLNQDGTAALGNAGNGIHAEAFESIYGHKPVTELTIGGSNSGNRISANKGPGIDLNGTNGATILGNFVGTNAAGTVALGNGGDGIQLGDGDSSVTVGGTTAAQPNIISGNTGNGVSLLGSSATVQGNFIGLGQDGSTAIANRGDGVLLASSGNTVGAGNVISGNFGVGVRIRGSNNLVTGSFIGTTADGAAAAGNFNGIAIEQGSGNTVQSDLISGNTRDGVFLSGVSNNKLLGNTIGLSAAGTAALANERGVFILGGSGNVVGEIGNGNVISGNKQEGVRVTNGASGTSLQANSIGTTKDGMSAVGNGTAGVVVSFSAENTTVGGTAAGAGNLISGNDAAGGDGVLVNTDASGTLIQGNTIGLNKAGTGPLANLHGVVIQDAVNTTVGGTTAGAGNLISSNTLSGINLTGAGTGTLIQGNTIGLDKNGATAPNLKDGINVQGGSDTTIGAGNVVSGNNGNGIAVSGADVLGLTTISDNLIGTNPDGTAARANGMAGVLIADATASLRLNVMRNIISGNAGEGVFITASPRVAVGDNIIGLNKVGTAALPNGSHGVLLNDAADCIIGLEGGNVISGNRGDGIRVGGGSTGTQIFSNTIGLRKGGAQEEANAGDGINVTDTANTTTIGGATPEGLNIISGNGGNGINIDVNTVNTQVLSNNIGLDAGQTVGLGNGRDGVHVLGKGVKILGNLKGANNVIAGNAGNGILISGATASGTLVQGFRIGTNGAGTAAIPNELDGILVTTSADKVTLGATVAGGGNLVSGNTKNGIEVTDAAGTLIRSNLVGTDLSGDKPLGNTLAGVFLQGTDSVTVGGRNNSLKNTVSANGQSGIVVTDATNTTIGFNNIGATSGFGQFPLGNGGDGVFVTGESEDTTVNSNLIVANTGSGVNFDADASGLELTHNTISPAALSLAPGNKTGVLIKGQNATIGGTAARQGNTIAGNATAGIDVEATAVNVTIQGNFIGRDSGNGTDGILVNGLAKQVTIGGTAAGARNVISGNGGNGIHLTNVTQTVKIEGNLIGTNIVGNGALKNAQDGVLLEGTSSAVIQDNTISGNGANGVNLVNGSSGNVIAANKIGVGVDGTTQVKNGGFGVWVHQGTGAPSSNNTIGGTAAGDGNLIGYNAKGVVIGDNLMDKSQQDAILGNSIFQNPSNGVLDPIDLGNNGPTYTPSGTAGPNLLEVPPTLRSATLSGSDLTVTGLLKGTLANTTYRIEIFLFADPTVGPFKRFLGFKDVTTDRSGNVVGGFSATFQGVAVPTDAAISATATDANGNTTGMADGIGVVTPPATKLLSADLGLPYSQDLGAANGPGAAHSFAVTDGVLPPWLTLDPATGVLSGTPVPGGPLAYTFSVTATAATGDAATTVYALGVDTPLGTSPHALYVASLYGILLDREPDASAPGWVAQLDAGAAPAAVVRLIQGSREYRGLQVAGLYRRYLHRDADPGAQGWIDLLAAGWTTERVAQAVLSSPEYLALNGGSPDGLVAGLYRDVLGRAGAPAERSRWAQALAGGASPADVAAAFFASREHREGVVRSSYPALLGREADAAGLATWAGALAAGVAEGDVLAAVLGSPEGLAYWS
jgi:parallel beta-helix repeat protein